MGEEVNEVVENVVENVDIDSFESPNKFMFIALGVMLLAGAEVVFVKVIKPGVRKAKSLFNKEQEEVVINLSE